MTDQAKLTRRLATMSAALQMFRTRQTNLARRDRQMAAAMRFAGPEAKFCLAEVKAWSAFNAAQNRIRQAEVDRVAAMTPEQRADRVARLRGGIEALQYAPWGVNATAEKAKMLAEIDLLSSV
jgi:hypothetical protein